MAKGNRKKVTLPGYEGKFELRPAAVRSPTQSGEALGVQMEVVQRNIRRDMLEFEYAHKHITEAQKVAGDGFLATYERAGIGGGQAIDYAQPKVDSSGKGDPVTDGVLSAHQRLARIKAHIGSDDYILLVKTICEGRPLKIVAAECKGPFPSKNSKYEAESYVGRRWRDALTALSNMDAAVGTGPQIRVEGGGRQWSGHVPLHQCSAAA